MRWRHSDKISQITRSTRNLSSFSNRFSPSEQRFIEVLRPDETTRHHLWGWPLIQWHYQEDSRLPESNLQKRNVGEWSSDGQGAPRPASRRRKSETAGTQDTPATVTGARYDLSSLSPHRRPLVLPLLEQRCPKTRRPMDTKLRVKELAGNHRGISIKRNNKTYFGCRMYETTGLVPSDLTLHYHVILSND